MSTSRVPSHIILGGLLRQADLRGIGAFFRHKGDQDRGSIALVFEADGAYQLLERRMDEEGCPIWAQRPGVLTDGLALMSALERLTQFDQDINILEFECPPDALDLDTPIRSL